MNWYTEFGVDMCSTNGQFFVRLSVVSMSAVVRGIASHSVQLSTVKHVLVDGIYHQSRIVFVCFPTVQRSKSLKYILEVTRAVLVVPISTQFVINCASKFSDSLMHC